MTESWTTESGSPAGIRLRGRSLGDAPEVVGLRITSNPSANDSYATGNVIEVTATFIDEVTVDTTSGTPRLALTVGSSTRYADYSASDSTATALVFAYPVTANDRDEDGISIVTDALELNGGAIHKKGDTSTDAVLDHGALSAQSGHRVNRAPFIVSGGVAVTSSPDANGSYATGDVIEVTATFSEAVTVDTMSGTPRLELTVGSNTPYADYSASDSTATALVFAYPVTASDRDNDGISIAVNGLKLNGGAIHKQGDTNVGAMVVHGALSAQSDHRVNADASIVGGGVAVTSSPAVADTYGSGETIEISVTFSEAVNATSATDFVLSLGGRKRAALLRGSGTRTLVFGYAVQATDSDTNGIWIGDQNRTLVGNRNGAPQDGAITSAATGRAADLTHGEIGTLPGHKVDGSQMAPQVTIATDQPAFTAELDDVTFTLTLADSTAAPLTVGVELTQDREFLLGEHLSYTVEFQAGESEATLVVHRWRFEEHEATGNGTLTATVQAGTGYAPGSPGAASTQILVVAGAVTARLDQGSYTFAEDATGADNSVTVIATTATGVPSPNRAFTVGLGLREILGEAQTSADFQFLDVHVTFDPSDFSADGAVFTARKEVPVELVDDALDEPDETLFVALYWSPGSPPALALRKHDGTACDSARLCAVTATITDDDEPPAGVGLVSNIGQASNDDKTTGSKLSQRFTIGSNANASSYTLTGVDVVSGGVVGFTAQVCETDAGGNPTSTCTDLIPPGAFAAGTVSFTAPAHTTLARGATYSVVMASAGIFSVSRTLSNAQDMGHAPDWSIADNFEALGLSNAWAADSNGNALRIAIKGAAGGATPSTDAELSGLSLGTGVTLTPTFASGTYAYAASVANAVDEVTVTPATNHASATIQYLNASDRALADVDAAAGHQVALAEGENLIKVKVTAQDATTTQTYAVTVTRAAAPATCTLETGDIWCGVLTVGSNSAGSRNGYHSGQYGQLSDTAFDLSSTEYTVESVRWVTEDEEGKDLILDLDALPAESVWSDRWYLQVDANKYYTANAVDMADQLRFRNAYESRPSPALNTTVTVRLTTSSAGALGHNALLTALTVNDGTDDLTLSPAFDNGTFDYTTSVAFGVETVTFTPTTFDRELVSYWTVATKLVDADAMADGFQVTLDVGANKIRVWALSEDGGDNTGYYVTVTRAGAVDTPTSFAAEAGDAQVTLSWEAPASALGVLRHEYRFVTFQIGFFYNEGVHLFGPWTPILDSGVGGANEDGFTVTGLTNNTVHIFQLRAAVTDGESVPATSEEVTPVVPDDFPDDTTTSGVVEVGGSATGHIEVKEDRDWFKVVLEADKTYQIDMEGAETGKGDLIDPSLTRILDEAGTLVVVFDSGVDDGGQGLNSRATFTPSVAGTYHVEAARFFSNTGTYTLTVREAMPTDATLSALMVNDGSSDLTLTPAFASGTYAYAVSVANAVDEITVTPTTNQAAATFAWLDADDNALADADTTTGHQVALAVGANVFKVKVTGGDGTSTLTYTVTVTRAAAPTTCTLATGDIWCGVLTVGSNSAGSRNGYHSGQYGQLSDTKFDLSSTEYTVESIRWVTATGQSKDLILDLDGLPAEDVWRTWRLQVDANKFSTTNVDPLGTDDQLRFENAYEARPAPALNTAVTVRLTTSSTGELGYDGALSALTVKDGNADLTLSPAFDRDTYDYTTSVASDVETVTFTATAIDRGSVVYRVGNTTLVDADAMAAGFQVTLEVGANAIDVDAFSEDGGFREIYTVTVTRAGAVDTPTSFTTEAAGFQVTLSWVAPASGSGVTGHEYRFVTFTIGSIYIEGVDLFGPWTQIPDSGVGGANEDGYTVTGLTNDVVHIFQVRAASASGYSAPATSAEVTPTVVDDFPADTTTSGVVAVGGSATGVIGSALDLDWFQVMLAAGKTYQIDMEGSETGRGDLDDPYLSAIHDGVGALVLDLTLDPGIDDGGQGLNSRATFTPSAAGAYYVAVAGRGSSTGGYTLFVREVMPADATLSALMVNDGSSDLTLTPAFASGTYAYTVSVANAVDEVTVTPTTNQAAATFAWLDADDNALADADTTTGHQVALAVGANVIKAKVTAADGDTTQTYTVTVTRAGGLPSLSIADAAATEGDDLSFTATLSAAAAAEVTATWTASIGTGDTAVAADLGTTKTGTVTVSMGTTTGTFTVSTTEDSLDEDDETFTVTLSNVSSNAQLAADPTAKGTINDDDGTTTTCTLNTGDVWCGTVTVGTETSTGGTTTGHGFSSGGSVGTLTDNSGNQTFTYGTQTYVVSRVVVGVGSFAGELAFRVQRSSPENFVLDDDHRAKLALHVAGSTTPFAFRDTTGYNATLGYVWSNSGLDWSSATTVTVRLRELPDAPTGFEAAVGNAQVGLTWDAPASGANITRHEFRYKTGGGSYPTTWTPIATSAPGGTNEAGYTVTGLTNEIAHTFELRAVNDSGAGAAVESDEVTPTPGICGRTEIVQEFLIYYLEDSYSVVRACAEVNVADLAQFTGFDGANGGIGSLKSGDFAGLTNVTHVFLSRNDFTTLPVDLFSDMTALRHLTVDFGKLTSLPDGVFSDLTLNTLKLGDNDLTSLPAGLFSGLSSLVEIQLHGNDLEALPDGLFSGLSSLVNLQLQSNNLEQLPAGLFSGLTGLTVLDLRDNPDTDDVLPLTVTVEKVGTDEARAKVLAGAPFAVNFTPTVVNGSLAASDTKLGVAAGSVEGTAETVTRTSGTTEPVTVDIDLTTQPSRPTNHFGYEFVKATSGLPKTILSDVSNNPPVFDPATAEREVPENSAAGTNVGAVIPEATDADTGDTLEYSLEGDDARFFDFDDSTRQITTKANVTYNYEAAKNSYEVAVKADDGRDSVTLAVTIRLTDVWERSAKPAPPTLSPISGSSTSLMASWVKPGRNGGPDITGYNVQYREGDGAWTDFAHDGTGVSTTITGLTAGASYQARVQAENGEGGSAWSDPSDAAVPNEAAGVLPRITAVRVTSVPELERDTYGRGETIRFTVYFSAPVAVTGSPHFTFSLGNRNAAREVDAPYESGSGTAALVFGYVVQEGDEDNNGIFLVDGDALGRAGPVALDTDETITALGGGLAADLSSSERGNQRDHKVDGSRALEGDAPTVVGRLKVTSWPARGGAAYGVGDTIVFTLTFSEKVRVKGQPQPALVFELGGEEHEARYHGLSDTDYVAGSPAPAPRSEAVKLHFEYRVGAGDRDDDGVSVGADAVRPGGATIRSAVTGFDADLFHGAVAPDPDHRVAAGTATEPAGPGVTIIDAKGNPLAGHRLVIREGGQGRYGLKLNTRPAHPVHLKAIMSDGDEDLSVLPSFTQPSIAPGAWGAPRWVDIAAADDADSVDGERVFLHRVHSKDPAYNDLLLPDVVVVEADDDPKESGPPPPEITAVAVASEPALESDTYGYGETIRFRVEFSERVTVGGQPHFTFSLGNRNAGRRVDAPYESGNRTTALVFGYEVQRGDEDDNGIFLLVGRDFTDRAGPVGLGRGGLILAVEGGVAADLAHDTGRGAQRGHQVDGSRPVDPVSPVPTPPTNPTVDSLAVNSWPQSGGDVYRSGDTIVFTVTFSEKVRVEEGQPALAFDLGGARHWGVYHGLSDDDYEEGGPAPTPRSEAAKLHFAYQVDRFDRDADGVEVGELSGAMDLRRGTIRSAETGLDADLGHAAVGPLSDPVDGLAAEPATTAEPLTAEFRGLPSEHDGRTAFRFRIEFSEEVAVSAAAMRDDALTVSGGTVTGAARVDGRADRWSIEVTPSGAGEIGISLPPERDCAEAGAVCTADGRSLTTGLAVLVAGPPVEPLTASFEGMPAEHGGEGGLHFRVAFSEDIGISYRSLREDAFAVSGGRVTGGRRVDDRRDLFRMTVRPDSDGDVTITLPAGRDCGVSGAICTKGDDRRQLTNSPSATVTGPVGISAADARVEEGDGAVLAFAVTLSRAAGGTVAVDYATADGSAHAGVDYRAASGTLEFRAGESSKTVEVTVFDDSHDEGEETLTLRLSNASSGRVTDSEATGTIKNTDPLPRALLARFGRTAAVQVVEQVEARLEASRDPGFRGRVAGRELRRGMERDIALGLIRRLGGAAGVGRGVGGGGASGAMAGASGAAGFLPPGTAGGRRRSAPALPMRAAGSMGAVATGGASGSTGAGSTGGAAGSMGMAPSTSAAPSMGMAPSMRGASGSMGIGAGPMGGPMGMASMGGASHPMGMGAGPMGGPMGMAGPMGGASGSMGMATRRMGGASGGDGWLNGRGFLEMGLGGGDVLTGSAFTLNRESGRGGVVSLWSRGARSRFSGREGALSLGGDVRTTMFGADYAKGPLVVGLSLSNTRGLGEYSGPGSGRMLSSVTGLYPWLGYRATDRITVWGVTGYGVGGMLLTPGGGPALESGLSTAMAAAGTRGELVGGGGGNGFALAFKADALWAGTAIDGVDGPEGRLVATSAAVTRVRTGLEGSRGFTLGGGLSLRPSVEVGLRHDGGDAETGAGVDVGGGLVAAHASSGLAVDVRVRTLLVHEAEGFSERGVSLSLSWNPTPSTPLGLTARLAPSWGGQATSGADALWGRDTMAGLGAPGGLASGNRLDAELGYGLPVGRRFVGTPRFGVGATEYGRDYRLGYGLGVLNRGGLTFELGVDAQRRESPLANGTSHGVVGRATVSW